MKITLEIPNGVVCAFMNGVQYTDDGMAMFSWQMDRDDLRDGNAIKLPREKGGEGDG